MIIQTGMRTDIPAFYAEWFANRIKEGYAMVRNPYQPLQVTQYSLNPDVVDLIGKRQKEDQIHIAEQKSWIDGQIRLFDWMEM